MECGIFARLETHLTICFSRKNQLKRTGTAIIMLYSEISIISIYSEFLKIRKSPGFRLPDCRPAVRPGSARCTAPEIQHSKGFPFPFTKLLFRRRFIHCAMVIPLYFLSLLSSLSIGMRKQFQHDLNIPYKV